MNKGFWAGKRVFITGHSGFMGGWLTLWLQHMQARVTGYALRPPTEPNFFTLNCLADNLETNHVADIRDLDTLSAAVKAANPEFIFHLAAQPLVRRSYAEPVETYSTNIMGTVNLLEAARKAAGLRVIVNITSDKCYENRERPEGYREDEPMGGYDPYSSSKGCAEIVTSAYRRSYLNEAGVALATARSGNVIGGGDWAEDRLIPDFIRAMVKGMPLQIRNPAAVRPWQHVLEPVRGYLELAEKAAANPKLFSDGWNFGPRDDDAKPVLWIAERLTEKWGEGASYHVEANSQLHEANLLRLNIEKAARFLEWTPRWSLARTLDEIVVWYKAWKAGEEMRTLSLSQIEKYDAPKEAT